jgi:hypothetical protein
MTIFAQISPAEYDRHAFEGFMPDATGFLLGNARALMWFSQLAYETHVKGTPTIPIVFPKWDFRRVTPFVLDSISLNGSFETCGLIGERDDAVIMAFAGTDPGIWQNLTTDFTPLPRAGSDTHRGFELAAAAAASRVNDAIALCRQPNRPFFIAGHSLGGALAALAALQAARAGAPPKAVYTFGMPRVGGPLFGANYGGLNEVTYRLGREIRRNEASPRSDFRRPAVFGRTPKCDRTGFPQHLFRTDSVATGTGTARSNVSISSTRYPGSSAGFLLESADPITGSHACFVSARLASG